MSTCGASEPPATQHNSRRYHVMRSFETCTIGHLYHEIDAEIMNRRANYADLGDSGGVGVGPYPSKLSSRLCA